MATPTIGDVSLQVEEPRRPAPSPRRRAAVTVALVVAAALTSGIAVASMGARSDGASHADRPTAGARPGTGTAADTTPDPVALRVQALQALLDTKEQAQLQYEAEIAALDAQLTTAQQQLDVLNGINSSIMSLADALKGFQASIAAAQFAQSPGGQITAAYQGALFRDPEKEGFDFWNNAVKNGVDIKDVVNQISNSPEAKIQQLYNKVLGRVGESAGVNFWLDAYNKGESLADIEKSFYGSDEYKAKQGGTQNAWLAGQGVPGFAAGGYHSGGWRMVGENGPEMEYTGPAHIVSNADSKDLLNNEPVVAAIDNMKDEMQTWLYQITKNTQGTDKTLKRWDYNGQPETRE